MVTAVGQIIKLGMRNMQLTTRFLEAVALAEDRSSSPLTFMWPMPGHAGGQFLSLSAFADWRAFVFDLGLRRVVPDIVAAKFARGQKLLLLAWIDFDLFMAGELIALTALELALRDRFGGGEIERRRKIVAEKAKKGKGEVTKKERSWADKTPFADLLKYMVEQDSLTDAKVPMLQRCGAGSVVGFLTGELHPTLAERRNGLAHGDPFGMSGAGSYCAGLFELVRDLIDYAYRDWNLHNSS